VIGSAYYLTTLQPYVTTIAESAGIKNRPQIT